MDSTSLLVLLASFVLAFGVARWVGKRVKSRREADEATKAQLALAQQSRQVRRAAARQKKGDSTKQ